MIKTTTYYLLVATLLIVSCTSDNGKYEQGAVDHLDKLSETIGNLNSCSYTLNTLVHNSTESEFINEHDVYMRGPDKMHVHTNGTKGNKGFWYDGSSFAYFSYNKSTYDTLSAPGNIIAAIDQVHNEYGIDFPAADFFYPTFTDDILDNFNEVILVGDENIDDVDCVVILASNDDNVLKIWIEKDSDLPHKMSIQPSDKSIGSYEAIFSNWRINPSLPDMLFEFAPPPNSKREKLQLKK